jgi:hypothetical protein
MTAIPKAVNILDTNVPAGKVHRSVLPAPRAYEVGNAPVCTPYGVEGRPRNFRPTNAPVTCGTCLRIMKESS